MDMQGAIESAVVGRMAGARRFVGAAEPREGVARWLYTERVEMSAAHVVEQGCELLGAAVGEVLRPAKVTLPVDEAAESWCDGLGAGGRAVCGDGSYGGLGGEGVAGGAVWGGGGGAGAGRVWGAGECGAVDDKVALELWCGRAKGFARAVPCSVGQMIALVRRAALVIGGDTGPLHLAAALERPVVGIYGPTDPARNGPFGAGQCMRVLRDASSVTVMRGRRRRLGCCGLGWMRWWGRLAVWGGCGRRRKLFGRGIQVEPVRDEAPS